MSKGGLSYSVKQVMVSCSKDVLVENDYKSKNLQVKKSTRLKRPYLSCQADNNVNHTHFNLFSLKWPSLDNAIILWCTIIIWWSNCSRMPLKPTHSWKPNRTDFAVSRLGNLLIFTGLIELQTYRLVHSIGLVGRTEKLVDSLFPHENPT